MGHLVIVGAMGSGKTTVGRLLADRLGLSFLDSDVVLEARAGETGGEIAARDGVGRLHLMELEVFLDACRRQDRVVISPAASVVDHEAGRAVMAANTTIWLTAPAEILAARTADGGHRRDVSDEEREQLRARRTPWFEELSRFSVDTGSLTPEEVVATILERLGSEPQQPGQH